MSEPNYAIELIELDLDYCALRYGETTGEGTCPAVLGVDSDIKCHNTLSTCAVRASFLNDPVTVRFAVETSWLQSSGIEVEAASIESVSYSPAVISLGEDMGQRASLTVTFKDHRHSDTGPAGDKYLADRDYNPYEQGTYWGKFRTRQQYLRGRPLRWIQGLLGQSLAEMETRHFVIESFDFDALNGKFTLTAKDTLKLADGDRAQAPLLSPGFLSANINNSVTAATLSPAGIGNTDYPASGYLNIGGKEIVAFTRSGDSLTITRAQFNTEAVAHNSGDRLQLCLHYNAEDPADVIADLFENYAAIDAAYIPIADWLAETEAFYRRVVTALIAEPTPVKTLVSELIQQCGLAIWWDDVGEEIRLQVLRAISTTAETFNESNTVDGTLQAREQPGKRISQVWCYFGILNPLKGVSDPDNFRSTAIRVDLDAEEDYGQPAIKKIFSRWIPFGGLTIADRVTAIQLGRFRTAPRHFAFELYRRGAETPVLGEGCRLFGLPMQAATGALADVPIQITRLNPDVGVYQVEAEEQLFVDLDNEDPNVHPIIIDSNTFDVDLRDLHDTLFGTLENGVTVNVTVNAGVIVGSTSTSTPALDIGTWPTQAVTGNRTSGSPIISGLSVDTATWAAVGQRVFGTGIPAGAKILTVDSSSQITLDTNASSGAGTSTALTVHTVIINLLLRGRIQGKGGNGGQGAIDAGANTDGSPGLSGGLAFYSRYGTNVDLSTGDAEIWGGAGGGGGAAKGYASFGCGGGGGAGSQPGSGGAIGAVSTPGFENPGSPGTTEAGGQGGAPNYGGGPLGTWNGGDGGGPGLAGSTGDAYGGGRQGGAGGAAGGAVDGLAYLDKTGTGDIRGTEV